MILFGLCIGIATFLLAGFGVALIFCRSRQWNIAECVCVSWLFGTGIVSLLLWIGGIFFSGVALRVAIAIACAFLGGIGFVVARKTRVRFVLPMPRNMIEWLFVAVIIVELVNMITLSFENGLGWDGLIVWEIKARYGFLNGGVIPQTYFTSPSQISSHPEYPLFIPLTELWLYLWMGVAHQFWAKSVFAIFYCVGTILLAIISTRMTGRRWIGGLIGAFLLFVPYLTSGAGAAVLAYVDFPLGVFYLAAIGYLVSFLKTNDFAFFCLSAVSASLLPWVKREGAILFLAAGLCATIVILSRKLSWRSFVFVIPPALISLSWQIYLQRMHAPILRDFMPVTWATLNAHLDRILPVLHATIFEMMQFARWSLLWVLVAIAFVYLLFRLRDARFLIIAVAIVAPIAAYDFTYLFSSWTDYYFHMATSLPRLLLQIVPVAWLAVALALPQHSTQQSQNS